MPALVSAVTTMMYVVKGWRELIVMVAVVDCNSWLSPLFADVILIMYPMMTPFWFSRGGGSQDRVTEVEDSAIASVFIGELDGAGENLGVHVKEEVID